MMKHFTTLVILCCILSSIAICSQCPPGQFKTSSLISPCKNCPAGSYCPGDDQSHKCQKGTISASMATQCSSCPSGRSNEATTYCVLPSAPSNAIEIFQDRPFKVSPTSSHVYMTIQAPPTNNSTFITFFGKDLNGLVVYATIQNGSPSSSNSLYHAIGVNATIISSVPNGILYFSLETKNSTTLEFTPKVLYTNYHRINMDGNLFNQKHLTFENSNIVTFHYNTYIPSQSTLQIWFELDSIFPQDCYLSFSDNNPNIIVPTPDNADILIPIKNKNEYRFQFNQPRDGPFVISVYSPKQIYDVGLHLYVLFY